MYTVNEMLNDESVFLEKFSLVKSMNTIVTFLNDERFYYDFWIHYVPVKATYDDFMYIAKDEQLLETVCDCFRHIMLISCGSGSCGFYVNNLLC